MEISLSDALKIYEEKGKNALWEVIYSIANKGSPFGKKIHKYLFWLRFQKEEYAEEIGNDAIERLVNYIIAVKEDCPFEVINRKTILKFAYNRSRDARKKNWVIHEVIEQNLEIVMTDYGYNIDENNKIAPDTVMAILDLIDINSLCSRLFDYIYLQGFTYKEIEKMNIFIPYSADQLRKKMFECKNKHRAIFQYFLQ